MATPVLAPWWLEELIDRGDKTGQKPVARVVLPLKVTPKPVVSFKGRDPLPTVQVSAPMDLLVTTFVSMGEQIASGLPPQQSGCSERLRDVVVSATACLKKGIAWEASPEELRMDGYTHSVAWDDVTAAMKDPRGTRPSRTFWPVLSHLPQYGDDLIFPGPPAVGTVLSLGLNPRVIPCSCYQRGNGVVERAAADVAAPGRRCRCYTPPTSQLRRGATPPPAPAAQDFCDLFSEVGAQMHWDLAVRPWRFFTPGRHGKLMVHERKVVHTVLLCGERLDPTGPPRGGPGVGVLPPMPLEMWLEILGMVVWAPPATVVWE